MRYDAENSVVIFHSRARKIFFALFNDFRITSADISRQKHENHFQQWQSQYVAQLKQDLESAAKEVMDHHVNDAQQGQLAHTLSELIQVYLNDFLQKLKAL